MSSQEPRHTPQTDEPDFLPSQAEGNEQVEPLNEHLRTPGSAEGEVAAYEETLSRQPRLQEPEPEPDTSPSLWERVKAWLGL